MEYKYKPGDFGDIKDLVRKANEFADLSWEDRANDIRLQTPNEGTSAKAAVSAKKSARTTKNSKGKSSESKRSGSKKVSTEATATESKNTKKPVTKQVSEETKPKAKDKVPPSSSSADNNKADKTPTPTVGSLDALWNAAKASKAKKLKDEDQTQVWIDSKLPRQIELLSIKCGKPAPTKHVVNAILTLFLEAHKSEIAKANR